MKNAVLGKLKHHHGTQLMIATAAASTSFCALFYLVLTVSVSGLLAAFPSYSQDTVMLLLSLPNFTGLLSILTMPLLLKRISHKAASIYSLLCLLLGGLICLVFKTSMPMLIVASCIIGLAYGGLSTIYPLLINRYIDPENSAFVVGLCTCTMQIGSLVSKLLGGFLASSDWSYVYFTYIFVVLALVIVCLCLPKEEVKHDERRSTVSLRPLMNKRLWRFSFIVFIFPISYYVIATHLSIYVESSGIGTASLTGELSALGAAVAAVSALLFSRTLKLIKGRCFEVIYLLMGLGYLFAGLYVSKIGAIVASVAGAVGISIFASYLFYCINTSSREEDAPLITSFLLTILNLAYSSSAYINNFFSRLLFNDSGTSVFLFTGLTSILAFVLVSFMKDKHRVQ